MVAQAAAMRSTPSAGLEILLDIPPLHLEALGVALRTRVRIGAGDTTPSHEGHRRTLDLLLREQQLQPPICSDRVRMRQRAEIQGLDPGSHSGYVIYTDGSKPDKNHSGCGWALTHGEGVIAEGGSPLAPSSTVFQAESLAISFALDHILAYWPDFLAKTRSFTIRTDSQSAKAALLSPYTESSVVRDCKDKINLLAEQGFTLAIAWVKGHSDNTGNELADWLAGTSARGSPVMQVPLAGSWVRSRINIIVSRLWAEYWDDITNRQKVCRQTHLLLPQIRRGHLKWVLARNRTDIKILTGVITGHAAVRYHLSNMGLYHGPLHCRFCGMEREESNHLLLQCPTFWHHRRNIFRTDHPLELLQQEEGYQAFFELIITFIKNSRLRTIFSGDEII